MRGPDAPALVMFNDSGTGGHPLAPLLKPGFRHTFCAVRDGHYWSIIDYAKGRPEVYVSDIDDLAGHYSGRGHTVIAVDKRPGCVMPVEVVSCVGLVKTVIGIRSFAITPWGLYRHLMRTS